MECTGTASKIDSHVTPLSRVRQRPPVAPATYIVYGFDSTTSMSTTRPLIDAGPILRRRRPLRSAEVNGACACAASKGTKSVALMARYRAAPSIRRGVIVRRELRPSMNGWGAGGETGNQPDPEMLRPPAWASKCRVPESGVQVWSTRTSPLRQACGSPFHTRWTTSTGCFAAITHKSCAI